MFSPLVINALKYLFPNCRIQHFLHIIPENFFYLQIKQNCVWAIATSSAQSAKNHRHSQLMLQCKYQDNGFCKIIEESSLTLKAHFVNNCQNCTHLIEWDSSITVNPVPLWTIKEVLLAKCTWDIWAPGILWKGSQSKPLTTYNTMLQTKKNMHYIETTSISRNTEPRPRNTMILLKMLYSILFWTRFRL